MVKKIIPILFTVFLLIGCGSDSDDSDTSTPASTGVSGKVQKGDFIKGSSVTIQELDENFVPTGESYQTTTTDDLGSFSMPVEFKSPYLEITTSGYYFNEVSGSISQSTITLHTIVEASETNVNVNVLTTLERERIKYLVVNSEMTFAEARTQAEQEILKIFNITDKLISFSQMDISQSGDSNAALLAISAILQGSNTPGELSELISNVIDDISIDGALNGLSLIEELRDNSMNINLPAIKLNMENRYIDLDLTVTVPTFEGFVDSDGNNIINKIDPDYSPEVEAEKHAPKQFTIPTYSVVSFAGYDSVLTWTKTVELEEGDEFKITATKTENTLYGPDGWGMQGSSVLYYELGTLAGKIGEDGAHFEIGSNYTGMATVSGPLYLVVDIHVFDDRNDKTGEIVVEIEKNP